MSDDLENARAEAITEVSRAMMRAAGEAMVRHGDDPQSLVILTAATAMFIQEIDRALAPGFSKAMSAMLERR